jgi:hypothetical protein
MNGLMNKKILDAVTKDWHSDIQILCHRDLMISSTFSPTNCPSAGATNSRLLMIWCLSIIFPSQVLEIETINNIKGKSESKAK